MRIWDTVHPSQLCDKHINGEWRELACVWSVIVNNKQGYAHHPEVARWRGHLPALYHRYLALAAARKSRGYSFKLDLEGVTPDIQVAAKNDPEYPSPWDDQRAKLLAKECGCMIRR